MARMKEKVMTGPYSWLAVLLALAGSAAASAQAPAETANRETERREIIPEDLYFRGKLYVDWFRTATLDTESFGQLSNRVRLELGRRPGHGWRVAVDVRDRLATSGERENLENQFILYDAYLTYDEQESRLSASVGLMNLYDTAGIGTLLGGRLGYRLGPSLTVGGYGGLETNIYNLSPDPGYQKYGAFARYDGVDARSISLSYNTLRFAGNTERRSLSGRCTDFEGGSPFLPPLSYG